MSKAMGDPAKPRVTAFLDTNVLLAYLKGEPLATSLFDPDVLSKVTFAINPIVIQELLLTSELYKDPDALNRLQQQFKILPLDMSKAQAWASHIRQFRNRAAHSNDLLILASADECDYLVTNDRKIQALSPSKPEVVTTAEFLDRLGGLR